MPLNCTLKNGLKNMQKNEVGRVYPLGYEAQESEHG